MPLERLWPQCQNNSCPLHLSCSRTPVRIERNVYHSETDPVDVLIIGDCPESIHRLSFAGPEKTLFNEVINRTCESKTIAYTYLVKGWPVDRDKSFITDDVDLRKFDPAGLVKMRTAPLSTHQKKSEILENCRPFLLNEIQKLRPKLIIVLGNTVKESIFPKENKSLLHLKDVFREFEGIPVRFMNSYGSVFRNPSSKSNWQKQLTACLNFKIAQTDTEVGSAYLIKNLNEATEYIECLKNTPKEVSIDIETLNLNKRYGNKIATLQFSETDTNGIVIPYHHKETPFDPDELIVLKNQLYDLFNKPNQIKQWVGHNLKFECNVLSAVIGTPLLSAPIFDTMIGAFLIDENRRERATDFKYGIYTLKQLALDYVNFDGYDKGILAQRKEGDLFDLSLQDLANYGAMDTYITLRLKYAEEEAAREQNYLSQLYNLMFYLYSPMILLFTNIEQNGFYISKERLRYLIGKDSPLLTTIAETKDKLKQIPEVIRANDILLAKGHKITPLGRKPWIFDFSKQNHPQTLFFDVCGLTPLTIGKSGAASVDGSWQEHNKNHPLVKMYMGWSEMRHLYDTFAIKLYDRIDPQKNDTDCNTDSCIRSNFNLAGPVTGRISSDKPNLQNIPRSDTPAKKAIKDIFSARPGHYLVQLDYKANEVRWVGILAQDEKLAEAIWQGKKMMDEYRKNPHPDLLVKAETYGDIHKQTAAMVFGKPLEDVTKDERQISKSVIFAILYGSSIRAVAEDRNKTIEEVTDWFNQFYTRFPQVAEWKKKTEQMAKANSYVEALHGRRRRFPIFNLFRNEYGYFVDNMVPNEYKGSIASSLRQCINSPIQGIASDYGMCAASLFAQYIRENNKPWFMCNAVHDSAVCQVPKEDLEEYLEQAEYWFTTGAMEYMAEVYDINFNLPLEVDFEIGLNWGSLQKWNFAKSELAALEAKLEVGETYVIM